MKRYTMEHYLQDLKNVTKVFEEGIITQGELLSRIHDITMRIGVVTRTKLRVELEHVKREQELITQILG